MSAQRAALVAALGLHLGSGCAADSAEPGGSEDSTETTVALEHASVAAFARFVLELIAPGAPSELVVSAQQVLGDEIEHARLCFGLASAYAGEALGPGALSAQGALDDPSFQGCVARAIHEACVGETLAAAEAIEALARATDPAVVGGGASAARPAARAHGGKVPLSALSRATVPSILLQQRRERLGALFTCDVRRAAPSGVQHPGIGACSEKATEHSPCA